MVKLPPRDTKCEFSMNAIREAAENQKLRSREPAASRMQLTDNIGTQEKSGLNTTRNRKEDKSVGDSFRATTNSNQGTTSCACGIL